MKVLSVCQPWAHLITHGPKRIENRTWRTDYRGRLLIHAGKSRTHLDVWRPAEFARAYRVALPAPEAMVFGAIVGMATLADCVPLDAVRGQPFAEGPWCWLLEDAVAFATPYPCRGALQLWTPPAGFVLPENCRE